MTRRPLLVGECNPYGGDPGYALYPYPRNSAGGRLCRIIFKLPTTTYLDVFDRVNLCPTTFSMPVARDTVRKLAPSLPEHRVVILCGSRPARAFGQEPATIGTPLRVINMLEATGKGKLLVAAQRSLLDRGRDYKPPTGYTLIVLPHPSGRNSRILTDANIEFIRGELVRLVPEVPWGTRTVR